MPGIDRKSGLHTCHEGCECQIGGKMPDSLPNDDALDAFREIAWVSFLHYALKYHVAEFEAETGITFFSEHRRVIDRMVGEATGYDKDCFKKFIIWATENLWGEDEAPQAYFRLKESSMGKKCLR